MKLPVSDSALDTAKKTVGTLLVVAAGALEMLAEFGVINAKLGAITTLAAVAGAWLAGFGMLGARGKTARAIMVEVFGTDKPDQIQKEAIAVAQQVASSLAPPPPAGAADNAITWPKQSGPRSDDDKTPKDGFVVPPPRSKP